MKNLILLATTGLLTLAFPVLVSAEDGGQQQQQQQQQSVSTSVVAENGIDFGSFDFGSCDFCTDGGFGGGVNQFVDVSTNVNQQQQQQQQQGEGDQNQDQQQQQNGNGQQQQQQQQKQVAEAVTTPPATPVTKTGTLPNAGADAAIPGMLATLGTSVVAYLKQKKHMATLAFMK